MFNNFDTSTTFLMVLFLYFAMLAVGYIFGKLNIISISKFSQKRFCDPLTMKLHELSRNFMMECIKKGKWLLVFLKIFLNNLILVAFVTRILYGIVFIVPLFFTGWVGFGHGMVFSKPKGRAGIILFFEFGGYLFASVVGVKLGVYLLNVLLLGKAIVFDVPWNMVVLSCIFLFIGALIETTSLMLISKSFDITGIDIRNYQDEKDEFIKMLETK